MAENKDVRPHIYIGSIGSSKKYTYPRDVIIDKNIPAQDRESHGRSLQSQINFVKEAAGQLTAEANNYELEANIRVQIAFESFPEAELEVEKLADATQGIELLNVKQSGGQIFATASFPPEKIGVLEKKLLAYLEYKIKRNGTPNDNRKLLDAIQSIRVATLEALWSDDVNVFPSDPAEVFWWEVWLPVLGDRSAVIHDFKLIARTQNIEVPDQVLEFPERSILLARGSREQSSRSSLLLTKVSELRRAKETAAFFDALPPEQQQEWSADLLRRLQIEGDESPYICVLDTGVNTGHPLLEPFITDRDQFAVDPAWSPTDDNGHGTGMCGLAVWGDLTHALSSSETVSIYHRLESVKLLQQPGDNDGRHHGNITTDGISLVEIDFPGRTRVFALAISATDDRDRGRPSAWSSSIDSLTSDYLGENQNPRLMIICAGNTGGDLAALKDYPDYNVVQQLHDPAQAWNALTVGAATFKTTITETGTAAFTPLAPNGGLSPYSTTSVSWDRKMPIKPEVVFEGGNAAKDALSCLGFASLHLLTTHNEFNNRHFSTFNATSAATALAAKFAAEIYARYPALWPETVRALIVHSAQWTAALQQQFTHGTTARQRAHHLVRVAGYGVPDIDTALWSLKNSLSLIIEDELQPFEKVKGKEPSTRDMHLHDIPWPKESLLKLGETEVTMTVTLSYFIEPNPSSRNVSGKYSYPSHQLRFDVKRPNESSRQFQRRISRAVHDLEEGTTVATGTDSDWLLGEFRHKGSVHKDVWKGTAAELAERGQIIIYPAMGWWRTRTKLERMNKKARYALIISIGTPSTDVDLYSEITNQIVAHTETKNEIRTEIPT